MKRKIASGWLCLAIGVLACGCTFGYAGNLARWKALTGFGTVQAQTVCGGTPDTSTQERPSVDAKLVVNVLDEEAVARLVGHAVRLSPYADPGLLPFIKSLPVRELRRVVCGGQSCGAVAFFDERERAIYFDAAFDVAESAVAESYVVHEIVHYLQFVASCKAANVLDCKERIRLEVEAYQVQTRYLDALGVPGIPFDARAMRALCWQRP